jgi:hypothetical protein
MNTILKGSAITGFFAGPASIINYSKDKFDNAELITTPSQCDNHA